MNWFYTSAMPVRITFAVTLLTALAGTQGEQHLARLSCPHAWLLMGMSLWGWPAHEWTQHQVPRAFCFARVFSVFLSVTLYILAPTKSLVSKLGSSFIHLLTRNAGRGHLVDGLPDEAPLRVVQGQSCGLCMSRGLGCFMGCLFHFLCGPA